MKIRPLPHGYTIVEVMIFLAISGGLLAAMSLVVSGQQQRTEFSQAGRDTEHLILDVINDTSTGYYANTGNFTCRTIGPTGPPTIDPGVNQQGTNLNCIFLGRAMQFGVSGTDEIGYKVYNLAGRRTITVGSSEKEVVNLTEASPVVVEPSTDSRVLYYGLRAKRMYYKIGVLETDVGAVAFISGFGKYNNTGSNLISGVPKIDLIPVPGTQFGDSESEVVNAINNMTEASTSSIKNPDGGVTICFEGGVQDQHINITIGSNGRQLSSKTEFKSGDC